MTTRAQKMATARKTAGSHAGPGGTFPLTDARSGKAAAHLVGHAANSSAVKAKIETIAKRKGLAAALPASWKKGSR